MTIFEKNIKQAFFESKDELAMQNRKTDEKYRKTFREYDELFERIEDLLGKNSRLLSELDDLKNEMGGIDEEYIYLQGMIDCVNLLRIIKII